MSYRIFVCITLIFFSLCFSPSLKAQPSGWSYYRNINVYNGEWTALSDYQVRISFNHAELVSSGKSRMDGNDIRFLNDNNSQLNFWIESGLNSSNCIAWVKIPFVASMSSITIKFFYGNNDNSLQNRSNGESTFILFDDFSASTLNLSEWTTSQTEGPASINGTVTLSNSEMTILSGKSATSTRTTRVVRAISNVPFDGSQMMRFKLKTPNWGGAGSPGFYRNTGFGFNTAQGSAGYIADERGFITNCNNQYSNNLSGLFNPVNYLIFDIKFLKLNSLRFFLNESLVSNYTNNIPIDNFIPALGAGEWSTNPSKPQSQIVVDWIFISKLTQNEPLISMGSENFIATLQTGLIAYYPFNGNANDGSGNGNNGTVNGATLTTDRFNNLNSAYSFNGSSYITVNNSTSLQIGTKYSVAFWFTVAGPSSSDWMGVVTKASASHSGDAGPRIMLHQPGNVGPILYFGGGASIALNTNQWYFGTLVSTADSIKLFLNGVETSSSSFWWSWTFSNSNPVTIGGLNGTFGGYNLNGKIDDIRIYNRALSEAEILSLKNENLVSDSTTTWRMQLNAATGTNSKTIEFGSSSTATNGIDSHLGEQELPPSPPSGIFDVRFELPTTPAVGSLKDFRNDILATIDWIIRFQPGTGGYPITFTWDPTLLPAGIFILKDMVTGTIVNINMKDQSSYTLSNTGITSLKISYRSSRLTISSGTNSGTIEFGTCSTATNGIDLHLGEQELPPQPPSGIFDVRFELPTTPAVGSIRDFRNTTLTTIDWIIKLQPGSSGYPMTITWDTASLPTGSIFLKDLVTGTIVSVNMKNQTSYTLTNTGITSLKIEYKNQICKDINVLNGWNMISIPVTSSDMSKVSLFPTATSPAYAFSNGYITATTLEAGKGYWLKFGSNQTVNICGNQVLVLTVPVVSGWNMIGGYDKDVLVSGITSTPSGIISSPFYGYNNGYSMASTLYSGKGYWVKVSQNGVLNLPTSSAKSVESRTQSEELEKAGKIIISDARGNSSTLFVTKEQLDLSRYELPPLPPSGIYDVRFSNDRLIEEMDGQKKVLSISSASYPIKVRLEGLNCTISDEIDGSLLNKYLNDGDEIEIHNPHLTKLGLVLADAVPLTYQLYQNYPNPFNPITKIKFEVPHLSKVKISVYNILGEEAAVLSNRIFEPGVYSIEFNSSLYSSGIYFYRMEAENYSSMKKMLILK